MCVLERVSEGEGGMQCANMWCAYSVKELSKLLCGGIEAHPALQLRLAHLLVAVNVGSCSDGLGYLEGLRAPQWACEEAKVAQGLPQASNHGVHVSLG